MMISNNGKKGAASSQKWRANASPNANTNSDNWRRRSSVDSGYESARSRSNSPPASTRAWSWCTCDQYKGVYTTYKDQERTVRRWLCYESGRNCPELELDNIDIGSLLRMAQRLKTITVPFSVSQGLRKAIEGRKAVIERWHGEEDYACPACPKVWRKVDESHKHHIKELERMLVILGIEKAPKPTIDPMSRSSWR